MGFGDITKIQIYIYIWHLILIFFNKNIHNHNLDDHFGEDDLKCLKQDFKYKKQTFS